eukprot:Em0016g844a
MLVESCSTTQPYSLLDILDENGISIDEDWNKESSLDEMQRDLIPYVGIECRSERAYGSSSSEFIGFVLPDLQTTSETDKIEKGMACMLVGEQTPVLPDPLATSEVEGVGATMFPEEQTSSNDATTGEEKGIVGTSETSVAEVLAKKKLPQPKQNLAIKVTVTWNSEHLAFDVKYDVLKCNEVMSSINSVIQSQKQKNLNLSNGQFSYFFKLTDEELEVVKGSIRSSLKRDKRYGQVLNDCNFDKTLEQFHSCFSFVFGLEGLLDKPLLHRVNGFKYHRYFVYERLHQISPDAAKQCLVELLEVSFASDS